MLVSAVVARCLARHPLFVAPDGCDVVVPVWAIGAKRRKFTLSTNREYKRELPLFYIPLIASRTAIYVLRVFGTAIRVLANPLYAHAQSLS